MVEDAFEDVVVVEAGAAELVDDDAADGAGAAVVVDASEVEVDVVLEASVAAEDDGGAGLGVVGPELAESSPQDARALVATTTASAAKTGCRCMISSR